MADQAIEKIKEALAQAKDETVPFTELDTELAAFPLNDYGNARRWHRRMGGDFIYVSGYGWYCWDGRRWSQEGGELEAMRIAHKVILSMRGEIAALKESTQEGDASLERRLEAFRKFAVNSGNTPRVSGMLSQARPYCCTDFSSLDQHRLRLSVRNGTLHFTRTGEASLRPHERSERITRLAEAEWHESAECPRFARFLSEIQPDAELRDFLQRWFGYCLTGEVSEQKMVFFHGTGSNGKSTLLNVIAQVFGDYATGMPFGSLVRNDYRRGSEATPEFARLPGCRLVRAAEPERGVVLAEAMVKDITGAEPMMVRYLQREFFCFEPSFKMVICTNHRPVVRGQDLGIWRRLVLVPFSQSIDEASRDPDLGKALSEERDGILRWLVEGACAWLRDGLRIPETVCRATEEYRGDSDPIGRFLAEETFRDPEAETIFPVLYDRYVPWCLNAVEEPVSKNKFGRVMADKGFRREKRGGLIIYRGLRVIETRNISKGEV